MDDIVDTRLILITPLVSDAAAFEPRLAEACAAGDVAAVVLRLAEADERTLLERAKPLVAVAQQAGAAVLLEGHADLVGKSGADGVHTHGLEGAREAVERFRPQKIVGAGRLRSRDEAMSAGEGDVDYVMFGDAGADGGRPPFDAVVERVEWWAEVFQTPCVGVAPHAEGVEALAAARGEFVALDAWLWDEPDIAAVVRGALAAVEKGKKLGAVSA
ncbi:thiamine phosphate synthase [Agaricicola taiwanensis]|uniref:Thiamine phosphate synthase n=1 Tax=Agaricicola taiwanensis TaxID=591372 RepID=A0A8J2VUV3_9RHOB|nr:thiamine phosphate synthase [Agaricicola taiwanensis]GGE38919.1 thiamine phosphate synthase [Agaricicola taiwanensis]